jgi:hypothetical protein
MNKEATIGMYESGCSLKSPFTQRYISSTSCATRVDSDQSAPGVPLATESEGSFISQFRGFS